MVGVADADGSFVGPAESPEGEEGVPASPSFDAEFSDAGAGNESDEPAGEGGALVGAVGPGVGPVAGNGLTGGGGATGRLAF